RTRLGNKGPALPALGPLQPCQPPGPLVPPWASGSRSWCRARSDVPSGIEFSTQQDDDRGNPQPGHEADDRAQGAVGLIELPETGRAPGAQLRDPAPQA